MRLILDTNVVLDILFFADPRSAPLYDALLSRRSICFTDAPCFAELERVTTYPEFALDAAARTDLLQRYRCLASACEPVSGETFIIPTCRDPDDQKFLVLAARSQGDLLITRDKHLLKLSRHRRIPPPCPIVTPEIACRHPTLCN
ncbi:putative toxin-antitoxin system toxin component, PIN family [Propionivibrio soli]|uniref:putative toxin-antitoxin system toxin component, PIN family n=1 Tax=Propionivibrio soli TaxID=2976531 RepID=UPI0021E8A423|nr:putative toxin-antitoxin system toxin component, PIN family [Propionivibrio soli]